MDITRNWRLKSSRAHLFAARCPDTGAVILPQQTSFAAHAAQALEVYTFAEEAEPFRLDEIAAHYARAAAR